MSNKKSVLIIGGLGYIGSSLTKYLAARDYPVTVLDNQFFHQAINTPPNVEVIIDDCLNYEYYNCFNTVINLAAYVGAPLCNKIAESAVTELNTEFVSSLTKVMGSDQLLIFPNTNSSYGSSGESLCTEESPMNPLSRYAQTKDKAEKYVTDSGGIAFRLATVFGSSPRMRWDLLVNTFCFEAYYKKRLEIFDPHYRRNFVAVNDVCRAFEFAIENQDNMRGQAFNLGMDECNMTKGELAQKVCNHFKAEYVVGIGVDPDKRDYRVSSAKLARLGFRATTSIDTGLMLMEKYLDGKLFNSKDLKTMRNV